MSDTIVKYGIHVTENMCVKVCHIRTLSKDFNINIYEKKGLFTFGV
jgi:hypothetical protein